MASKFTIHNGLESNNVNAPINVTTGLEVGGLSFPALSGIARFVDAASTAGDGDGRTRGTAFPTIAAALAVAQAHDVIIVYPGTYAENLVVNTNYVTLAGVATGYGRPDIAPAAGVALTVNGQGFVARSLRVVATTAEACRQVGNGFDYADCVFDGNGAGTSGLRLKGHDTNDSKTASEGVVSPDCLFRGCATAIVFDTAEPAVGVGSTHCVISGRFIDNTQDLVTADSGPGTYSVQDTLITKCQFLDKNKTNYIDFTTANGGAASDQTGMISDCYFGTDSITTTNVAIVGTGFVFVGNYDSVGVQDGSGLD